MKSFLVLLLAVWPVLSGCSQLIPRSNAGIACLESAAEPVASVAIGAKYAGWALSAPLVAALAPAAALAWATPWVDLPAAVDFASAPAVGMGYGLEAVVGFPMKAACWWRKDPPVGPPEPERLLRERPWMPWGLVVARFPGAASTIPGSSRPAVPISAEDSGYYAVRPEALELLRRDLAAALLSRGRAKAPLRIPLPSTVPSVLEFYPAESGEARPPLVLLTPPVQADFAARYLARRSARRGVHAALVLQDRLFLEPGLGPREIEAKFRESVVIARTVLHALLELETVDRERVGYLGVSAGGIFGAALMALEPAIGRAALVLPGGDLPRIIASSEEDSVTAYREAWAARGTPPGALAAAIAREVRTDPLRLARHVDPERVLLFLGASDTLVPIETGLALRRALGEPETWLLSGNHDTASLCFGFILRQAEEFLWKGPAPAESLVARHFGG